MIRLQNIYKSFDKTAVLKGVNLHIEAGETMVLLGLSGSGKTTTLKLINGLEKPDEGRILFNENPLEEQDLLTLRRQMGYVIQEGGLFPHYTVFENVAVVPRLLGWDPKDIEERYQLLLQKLALPPNDFRDQYPEQLSGGQQQRIGLARALAADPPVLLMDEPFGALDPITRTAIRQQFLELDELREKTVVLVTHDVQEAFEMGHRIAFMDKGVIVQCGTPDELLNAPANDFVHSFFRNDGWVLQLKSAGLYQLAEKRMREGKLTVEDFKDFLNTPAHE